MARKLSRWYREAVTAVQKWDPDQLLAELDKKRFQRVECLEAYLDRVEELANTDPKTALTLALRGPEYAGLGDVDYEARAWALLGSVHRILGDLASARQSFRWALKILGKRESAEAAGVRWLLACLLGDEGRVDDGLVEARKAISYFREHRDEPEVDSCDRLSLAAALNREAILLGKSGQKTSEVAQLFLAALRETNDRTPRTAAVISKNFAVAAVIAWMAGEPGFRADQVLKRISSARRNLESLGYDRHALWGARLQWVQGMALAHLACGWTPAAEYHIKASRSALMELGAKQDVILVNLDEGYWLAREGQWERLEALALETLHLAELVGLEHEKQAALRQWLTSIESRTIEADVFETVYRDIRGVPSLEFLSSENDDSSPTGW